MGPYPAWGALMKSMGAASLCELYLVCSDLIFRAAISEPREVASEPGERSCFFVEGRRRLFVDAGTRP